jgi:signal transduction histidine kinase
LQTALIGTRSVLRSVYVARLILAGAIYLAALFVWLRAEGAATLVASLAFIATMAISGGSYLYTDVYNRPVGKTFLYVQSLFDLLLVTAVVRVTGGTESAFAALYILVIGVAALLHDGRGIVLIATLGIVLHSANTLLLQDVVVDRALWLQLVLFAAVALGSGLIGARLRAEGAARHSLAAELAEFRLREADVQRLRARADRLEAVARLSASLAHEIKNPLAAIRSAAEQLAGRARDNEEERALAQLATRESDRLARLLSQFLDFSGPDPGSLRTLDVRDVVRGAVELAESHPARSDGVAIAMLMPDRPLPVDGNTDMLHGAIFNLVLNAVQASPEGGVVLVEAEELSSRQTPVGDVAFVRGSVAIRVSDQGPGVSDALSERVFDPFFTTKEGGTGLGLAVVQRAVTAHGGHVVVASTTRGARFTVLLPRSPSAKIPYTQRSAHG